MLRKGLVVLVIMGLLLVGATTVLAQGGGKITHEYNEDVDAMLPLFDDGRLNAYDIDAPIAIFYDTDSTPRLEANGNWVWKDNMIVYDEFVVSLDIYARLPGSASFQKVMCCPIEELNAQVDAATQDLILMEREGYRLGYSVSGYFWVSAPNGYFFAWQR